jgi:phage shock protein C
MGKRRGVYQGSNDHIKRLYRSKNKLIGGVCGGLGDYLKLNSWITRILYLLGPLALGGFGTLIYIVLWVFIPVDND